jgi:protein associated with RNAse G/E
MHWQPATWDAENHAIAYFWPGRWYVIHTFYTRGGVFAGCYCDIVLPNPTVAPAASDMRYTDLYVDVVVRADRSVFTKDQEVYDRAMLKHDALVAMHDEVFRELAALANHAEHWTGPFALISDHLARDDWHTLDPADPDFVAACADQWPIPFEQA